MEEAAGRERPPWRCTVAVQAARCLVLYAAFSLGEPQLIQWGGGAGGVDALGRGSRGGAFLSVSGGAQGPIKQARLLRQMETIAKAYEVKLVLDVAQLGEDDPLWQNEPLHDGKISTSYRGQTKWLDQSLALTDSSW
ncbi:unnamed protein product [Miscanthus lutarioriparius]|uniref:Uncharacterized protein n=1 Tax=Miscanthus lutarioriparius TaxID=422564 RepID=A0A811S8R8_9POAL|nr:unnamed protein product [Miscanthus lutarioriparius]